MYTTQPQNDWIKQLLFSGMFVGFLAVALWGGSLLIEKVNDDQKIRLESENKRLTKNNLQLVRDNQQLRKQDQDKTRRLDTIKQAMEGYK